jgi:tetratricopeptide (TPR) repeat protein
MPYDLFISYSRRDDKQGQVRALKEQIEADYCSFAKEDLRCFFDTEDIATMDDWRHRILEGLRESNLLLLVLSPAYLNSPYCEWEIVEFLKYEHSRSVGGQGVTPVYFVEIPALDDPGFEQQAASWVALVRRRNQADLRPWFDEGAEALKRADVRHRLDDLERSLHTRLSKLRRLREAPGNLPAHNPRFVGREAEMQRLHEAAGLGRFGVLTAVQGMGGVGKTALAIQYAYAYADFYPGGRWLVGCAGEMNLSYALRRLDLDLGITLDEAEKRDDTLAARRVLAELEHRAIEGAKARAGEKDPPQPKALLLLDNVDHPALLQPPQSDLLTGRHWLHVVASTRSGAEDFGNDPERLTVLSIDELPDGDALRLIESYQPGGRFPTPQERDAALELVRLLGGFTLAIEVVAVHLGERDGRVTCAAFLERMKKEGVGKFDDISRSTKGGIRHGEKLVGATLKPTLDLLSEAERLVLNYATLLPPDTIPLPWLRALAAEDFPELGQDAEPGYDDPWLSLVNHLLGLRLLQTIDLAEDGRTPRLVRMHRLVGELVRSTTPNVEVLANRLASHLKGRCNEMEENWHLHQWEIPPLIAFAQELLARCDAKAPTFIISLCQWLTAFDNGRKSEPILRACLAQLEQSPSDDPLDLSVTLSNLGWALRDLGRHREAEIILRRALELDESAQPVDEHALAVKCVQLAQCLREQQRLSEAEPFCRKALELAERVLGPQHSLTLRSLKELGELLYDKGEYSQAEPLFKRAIEAKERVLGPEHPNITTYLIVLAELLRVTNRLAEAERLYRRALAIDEKGLGPEHPKVATALNNLALLLERTNRFGEAEPLLRRALAIWEKSFGPEHPEVATGVNNLASFLEHTNRLTEAESLYRRALAIKEKCWGPQSPKLATVLNNLALLLKATNRLGEAEPLHRRVISLFETSLGVEHPRFATSLSNLAQLLCATNRLAEAEPLMRRALAIDEKTYGPDHSRVAEDLNNLAHLLQATNRAAEGEPLIRRALAIDEKSYGSDHPDVARDPNNPLLRGLPKREKEQLQRRVLIGESSAGFDDSA